MRRGEAPSRLPNAQFQHVTQLPQQKKKAKKGCEVHICILMGILNMESFSYQHVATWRRSSACLPSASNAMPVHGLSAKV